MRYTSLIHSLILICCLLSTDLLFSQSAKISPSLQQALDTRSQVSALVILKEQARIHKQAVGTPKALRATRTANALKAAAKKNQGPLLRWLEDQQIDHQAFYIVNAIRVDAAPATIKTIAQRAEVAQIILNDPFRVSQPIEAQVENEIQFRDGIEWGVQQIGADQVWALGFTGQGVIVGDADTGVDPSHPTIREKYMGWNADSTNISHDYHWHDAIDTISELHFDPAVANSDNPCGLEVGYPCDDQGHGTHTVGTMLGDDNQGNQIGVAPGAKWIACRNMERGWGKASTYIECFEFFLAPYPVGGNPMQDGDPEKAPHVINNSWACPPEEGCNPDNFALMSSVVDNLKQSGIVVVVSAGNNGPECGSMDSPAAIFESSFSVGATNNQDTIANFSSRGLISVDSSFRMKPNVCAPGVQVRSCYLNGEYRTLNGTSMAGPHVAGAVALMISANPALAGQVDLIENILEQTALGVQSEDDCFGAAGTNIPNPAYGFGRINALAAVNAALEYTNLQELDSASVRIFPNPSTGEVNIQLSEGHQSGHFRLYGTNGRLIHQQQLQGYHSTINLNDLPAGIWLYQVQLDQQLVTGKLVIQ